MTNPFETLDLLGRCFTLTGSDHSITSSSCRVGSATGAAKEVKARIKINKLLEESGWRFFDDALGKAIIVLESKVKLTKAAIGCVWGRGERDVETA